MSKLFTSIQVAPIVLSHRVVMALLTRMRSEQPSDVPGDLMVNPGIRLFQRLTRKQN